MHMKYILATLLLIVSSFVNAEQLKQTDINVRCIDGYKYVIVVKGNSLRGYKEYSPSVAITQMMAASRYAKHPPQPIMCK